jgi:hypothetical protein
MTGSGAGRGAQARAVSVELDAERRLLGRDAGGAEPAGSTLSPLRAGGAAPSARPPRSPDRRGTRFRPRRSSGASRW